ncbi:MAG: MarR family transcriptional regulator [Nocardioides sp.]|jgi:DNA-binding MarR family transcriptional regulator|uniref:MarR family winged helix-turn-helix transcriptional regulator n=1 Tax=Nocardioides sp. TaxID=35761 RepID=UPI00261D99D9|nr:MarR family transcriptional regulator [Nocardioides sp.]MCW2834831.1 MarR family transcriptional regulator [Nocardioides sp.]
MTTNNDPALAAAVLRVASQLVDGIQQGLAARGFTDVRPAHGYAFARLSGSPATASELAAHLGVTKQAAAQLADHLVERGYLRRKTDPADRRSRLLVLTQKGWACTEAADAAAADTLQRWRDQLTPAQFEHLQEALRVIGVPGPLRPAW